MEHERGGGADDATGMAGGWHPSLDSLRELRLQALLNDLVKDLGLGKAAEQFGAAGA